MKFKIALALMALLLSSCAWQNDPLPNELGRDWEAKSLVKSERYEDALQKYLEMIEVNPNRFSTHSNIGVLLSMLQKPEEAEKSLLHALQLAENSKNAEAIFSIRFNLGVFYGAQKKVAQALEHYQQALEVLPTSIETKTNIELLIQQQNQQGQGESNSQDKNNQQSQGGQNQQQNDQQGDQEQKDQQQPQNDQQRQNSSRYKPRPYQGDQLSEGDVKKILGELRNQEQKIRANFDKKEKGKSRDNEKDW